MYKALVYVISILKQIFVNKFCRKRLKYLIII
jgi:hypothetical protein